MSAPTTSAAQLVELAELERTEYCTRLLLEHVYRIVGAVPEGEATDADLDWVTESYMAWVAAWEALQAARRG